MTKNAPTHRIQAIVEGDKAWPLVGNVYPSRNGAYMLVLDRGVKIILADGTLLECGDDGKPAKLFMRPSGSRVAAGVDTPA